MAKGRTSTGRLKKGYTIKSGRVVKAKKRSSKKKRKTKAKAKRKRRRAAGVTRAGRRFAFII